MENYLNSVFENIKNAITNGELNVESFMSSVGCTYCPLREACGKAADEGDSRTCEMFIKMEAK